METRNSLKKVVHRAQKEYKEKRPKSVRVLQVKNKNVFTRGILPEIQIKQIGPIFYLITAEYGDIIRIYFFNKKGELLEGKNFDITPKLVKKLDKSTVIKIQFPRKKRKIIKDITTILQKEFIKIHRHISNDLGINLQFPFTLLVDTSLQVKHIPTLGCLKKENKFYIPSKLQDTGYFNIAVSIEWFYTYLSGSIPVIEEVDEKMFYYPAILLTGMYNFSYIEKLKILLKSTKIVNIEGNLFDLNKMVKFTLDSINKFPLIEIEKPPLKKYLNMLQTFKKYQIHLSLVEFIELFKHTCEMFEAQRDYNIFYTSIEEDIRESFFFQIFSRAHTNAEEIGDNSLVYKTLLLSMLFGLKFSQQYSGLTEKFDMISHFISMPIVRNHIPKVKNLISDVLMNNIIFHYLTIRVRHASNDNIIDVILEINNNSDYVFQDIHYDLLWKPKNRLSIVSTEDLIKSIDLHNELKKRYLLKKITQGNVSLFCYISIKNPIYQDQIIKTTIHIEKINL